jgi:hypothetical protein
MLNAIRCGEILRVITGAHLSPSQSFSMEIRLRSVPEGGAIGPADSQVDPISVDPSAPSIFTVFQKTARTDLESIEGRDRLSTGP